MVRLLLSVLLIGPGSARRGGDGRRGSVPTPARQPVAHKRTEAEQRAVDAYIDTYRRYFGDGYVPVDGAGNNCYDYWREVGWKPSDPDARKVWQQSLLHDLMEHRLVNLGVEGSGHHAMMTLLAPNGGAKASSAQRKLSLRQFLCFR